jgi:hypothetical protein
MLTREIIKKQIEALKSGGILGWCKLILDQGLSLEQLQSVELPHLYRSSKHREGLLDSYRAKQHIMEFEYCLRSFDFLEKHKVFNTKDFVMPTDDEKLINFCKKYVDQEPLKYEFTEDFRNDLKDLRQHVEEKKYAEVSTDTASAYSEIVHARATAEVLLSEIFKQ